MKPIFWYGLILVAGGVSVVVGLIRFFRSHFAPDQVVEEPGPSPTSPFQRTAWWSIGIVAAMTAGILPFFLKNGIEAVFADRAIRLPVTAILVAGVAAWGLVMQLPRRRGSLDERDRMILARIPKVQLVAVFVALIVWVVAVTEFYWDRGAIPVVVPYLMLESIFVVNLLAYSVGVLLGYRRLRDVADAVLRNHIRRLRFEADEMTQRELADRVGCSRQTIVVLEQGRYVPSLALAFRIAGAFGVGVEDVFEYVEAT